MHRLSRVKRTMLWGVLLGLASAVGTPAVFGQPAESPPPAPPPAAVTGVNGSVLLAIGGTQRLQMSKKQVIDLVQNQFERIARVQPIPSDPTSVNLTGLEPGITRIALVGRDKSQEVYEVVVQLDVEYLRTLLRRAVPTASVQLIPAANNTVILAGYVGKATDVDLVVRTAANVLGGADRVLNALTVGGVQQVQLDVKVAAVSRSEIRRLSFEFLNVGRRHIVSNGMSGLLIPNGGITGAIPGAPVIQNSIGPVNGANSNIFFGIITPTQDFYGFLQALRDESVVKTLAEPKLVALSGRPASFLSGGEQAIPVPAGLGQVGIQFEEFGTRLNFLPVVLGNGRIHLEVEPEVSNLNAANGVTIQGTIVPGRVTQRVHTTVEMDAGQTLVIGGLIQRDVTGNARKVPILGDLPYLGAAFSSKIFTEVETELVVVVTPHLVDAATCDQLPKLLPGQETRSPDDFELFLEGILEAPRGPRDVKPGGRYVPAFRNSATAATFPCGDGRCATSPHGLTTGCQQGPGCATCAPPAAAGRAAPATLPVSHAAPAALPAVPPIPPAELLAPRAAGEAPGGEATGSELPPVPKIPTTEGGEG